MRSVCSSDRALWARGRGSDERRSTPSMSNAKAKSGCFAPGLVVIRERDHCAAHVGLHQFDSTEGLASLLNVVVAVVAIVVVCRKVKESS